MPSRNIQWALATKTAKWLKKTSKKRLNGTKRQSERHSNSAKTELAKHYLNGTGVEKDAKKATKLLSEAAEVIGSEANYILATCYENGIGVKKDMEKADVRIGLFWCNLGTGPDLHGAIGACPQIAPNLLQSKEFGNFIP